ncbi:SDR family NAD(P)-dependent oxidoreductase [Paenibacillus lignilyticus]|uniref:SDR family oxidoreductase n=1 Tax=Paenibacillus lignilyticus TaxID=1172615 RepID=A0ABS5CJR4_9BACL|nr:SDR family NAD(P)-dependent oxidoreductase [Paenibacillus lignilyticus]MBP3966125.1 SDR family oxidoreductase [Paenibacillus lignilyticus]
MIIDLQGKVAIVTGAGRGIGRHIALTLAKEGVITIATDIKQEQLDELALQFAEEQLTGAQFICDVRDSARIAEVVEEVRNRFGRIDILINNAGVASGGTVELLKEDVWDANMDINMKGTFLMCQAVVPIMKAQGAGRILNAASFAAIVPAYGSAAYASSKAAVKQFTRVLAGELGPYDITVNCYSPGMIPTEMNHFAEQPEERQQKLLDTLTLRRWGSKDDVANLICFLASDLAGYITGTMIDVSGGKFATQIPSIAYEAARKDALRT